MRLPACCGRFPGLHLHARHACGDAAATLRQSCPLTVATSPTALGQLHSGWNAEAAAHGARHEALRQRLCQHRLRLPASAVPCDNQAGLHGRDIGHSRRPPRFAVARREVQACGGQQPASVRLTRVTSLRASCMHARIHMRTHTHTHASLTAKDGVGRRACFCRDVAHDVDDAGVRAGAEHDDALACTCSARTRLRHGDRPLAGTHSGDARVWNARTHARTRSCCSAHL